MHAKQIFYHWTTLHLKKSLFMAYIEKLVDFMTVMGSGSPGLTPLCHSTGQYSGRDCLLLCCSPLHRSSICLASWPFECASTALEPQHGWVCWIILLMGASVFTECWPRAHASWGIPRCSQVEGRSDVLFSSFCAGDNPVSKSSFLLPLWIYRAGFFWPMSPPRSL